MLLKVVFPMELSALVYSNVRTIQGRMLAIIRVQMEFVFGRNDLMVRENVI